MTSMKTLSERLKGVKTVADNMFGFIFKQPIYKTFIQMRLISVVAITFSMIFMWIMWSWYSGIMEKMIENGTPLPEGWSAPFWVFIGSVLAGFWKAVNHITESSNKD